MSMFVIEDEWHAEWIGEFSSRDEAIEELKRLAELSWDQKPNLCPCTSWRTCGRRYHLVEFDTAGEPWRSLSDEAILEVSAKETAWVQNTDVKG